MKTEASVGWSALIVLIFTGKVSPEVDPTEPVHQVLNLPEFNERAVSLRLYSKLYDRYAWRTFPNLTNGGLLQHHQ